MSQQPPAVRPIYSVHVASTARDGSKRTVCVHQTMDREEAYRRAAQFGAQGSVRQR